MLERRPHDGGDLVLGGGPHHHVGDPGELSASLEDEVAQRLAARVDDAVQALDGHERRARPPASSARAQAVGQVGLGHRQVLEAHRSGSVGGPTRMPSTRSMKGARSGLSSWVNSTPSCPQPHHFIAAIACWTIGDGAAGVAGASPPGA